ncbi:hypothetical protein HNR44_001703 [Geomicrobium halophilum]|uniref:Transposase IS110-like N-terminal domain-containing protein n=1 Tax=Geomicrobium halophilum TaxID=549000 RepID=A0A841PZA3_9BACL|nr:transposase [Geomicrobium halophilum]MBB6449725.1 hypothetical protein [Geomicrobium halophilum]
MGNQPNLKNKTISKEPLIVGIDHFKETNFARSFDCYDGHLSKRLAFNNDIDGFHRLVDWITATNVDRSRQVILGMAETNNHWMNIAYYAKSKGFLPVIVNPAHIKESKEFSDPSLFNNEFTYVITQLIKNSHYTIPNLPEGIYAELQQGIRVRNDLLSKLQDTRKQIDEWIDYYFPELTTLFNNWECNDVIHALTYLPLPEDIMGMNTENIALIWKLSLKKADLLKQTAQRSVGVTQGTKMVQVEINMLMSQYRILKNQWTQVDHYVKEYICYS